jgi:hypothetical protein
VIVRLLLMHPHEAARYALGTHHANDVLQTEHLVRKHVEAVQPYGLNEPTIGLWYFRHEPSVAILAVDDDLLQLGWYFREPVPGDPNKIRVRGNTEPAVLARGEEARTLMSKVRAHFGFVWRHSEPGPAECFFDPKVDSLRAGWESLRRTSIEAG